ncbi:MAG TPA: hypothetical protein VIR27_13340 [Mycobacteriales bacterium]
MADGSHELVREPVHVGIERVAGLSEDLLRGQPRDRLELVLVKGRDLPGF